MLRKILLLIFLFGCSYIYNPSTTFAVTHPIDKPQSNSTEMTTGVAGGTQEAVVQPTGPVVVPAEITAAPTTATDAKTVPKADPKKVRFKEDASRGASASAAPAISEDSDSDSDIDRPRASAAGAAGDSRAIESDTDTDSEISDTSSDCSSEDSDIPVNLLDNPDLEIGNPPREDGAPQGWHAHTRNDKGTVELVTLPDEEQVIKVTPSPRTPGHGFISVSQIVPVRPGATYELSANIKPENLQNAIAVLNVNELDKNKNPHARDVWKGTHFTGLDGTKDWENRSLKITARPNTEYIRVFTRN